MNDKTQNNQKTNPMSAVLGEIVWLMSQTNKFKHFFITDLEWAIMVPVLKKKVQLFKSENKTVAAVIWASVSKEVAERLAQGQTRMQMEEWESGEELWIVDTISPLGRPDILLTDFLKGRKNRTQKNEVFKVLITEKDKSQVVKTIELDKEDKLKVIPIDTTE